MTTNSDDYLERWSTAMQNEDVASALSVCDEGLHAATEEGNTDQITFFTNLKKYTENISDALTFHRERNLVTLYCSMCGRGEADGCILVAGAECVICDECIKICVGVVDTQRRTRGKEFECSFCGKKESEVSRIIAGPGVSICENCCNVCVEILVRDSDDRD